MYFQVGRESNQIYTTFSVKNNLNFFVIRLSFDIHIFGYCYRGFTDEAILMLVDLEEN